MRSTFEDKSYSAYSYNVSVKDALVTLCQPLAHFGVDSFVFQRIFLKKEERISHLTLSNNLGWVKQHLLNCNYLGQNFLEEIQKADVNITKYYSWQAGPDNPKGLSEFGINAGFNIYERKEDYLEVSSFCSKKVTNELTYNCLNNRESIKQFITYFKTKAATLIDTSDLNRLSYFEETYEPINPSKECSLKKNIQTFSEEIRLNKFYLDKNCQLSKREIECVFLLSQGKSLKETGFLLRISPRTVESYLNQIKSKTGYNKSQIVNLFIKSEYTRFFNKHYF